MPAFTENHRSDWYITQREFYRMAKKSLCFQAPLKTSMGNTPKVRGHATRAWASPSLR